MLKQEIIEQTIIEIENHGIDVIGDNSFPIDAITNNRKKITIYNPQIATPFKLTHELIHIINCDIHRFDDYDSTSPQEKRANTEAILKLWNFFEQQGGTTEELYQFIEVTGCPEKLTKIIVLKSKIKSWDKEEVQYQVTHYLDSTDDEPESWNVYSIMDACNIDHKWESLVMSTLLDLNSKFNSQKII